MQERLSQILEDAKKQLNEVSSMQDAEDIRIKVLGKKGQLTEILRSMGGLAPEERKELGMAANKVRADIESLLDETFSQLKEKAKEAKHPLTITVEEIARVFKSMGFSLSEGPEVETVFNNFDALNAGPNHPARDWTDTFYINDDILLRTQTSPVQVRTLLKQKPPIRVFAPGRCFRCDTPDATHSPMFHQVEGLVVDEGITPRSGPSSVRTTSRLQSRPQRWTFPALSAAARAAESARAPAGSRSSAAVWCTRTCSRSVVLTPRNIPDLRSVWVWNVSQC